MKYCLFLTAFLVSILCFSTSVELSGTIESNTNLNVDSVLITGDVIVPNQITLSIQNGIKIIVNGDYSFTIKGTLLALGQKDSKILFTSKDSLSRWKGLRFDHINPSNDSSILVNTVIEFCENSWIFGDEISNGGGISVLNSHKVFLNHCIIKKNLSDRGGGVYIDSSNIRIENCTFTENEVSLFGSGAGLTIDNSSPTLINNTFTDNHGEHDSYGGAIAIYKSSPVIDKLIATDNSSYYASCIYLEESPAIIKNSLLAYNYSSGGTASGIYAKNSNFQLVNATITENYTDIQAEPYSSATGIQLNNSSPEIVNSIIYNNQILNNDSTDQVTRDGISPGSFPSFRFNNIQKGKYFDILNYTSGENYSNISVPPLFESPQNYNFKLQEMSPCIDYGENNQLLDDTDLEGMNRVVGQSIDLGAYEFQEIIVSTQELNLPSTSFDFYPTSTKNSIIAKVSTPTTIIIYNIYGKILLTEFISETDRIDLKELKNGSYFISNGSITKPLIKI